MICTDNSRLRTLGAPPKTSLEDLREWSRGLYYSIAELIQARDRLGDRLIGCVLDYAGTTLNIPAGFVMCYGQAVGRKQYPKLFDIIGTSHGSGDSFTTFNLPDVRDKVVLGVGNMGGTDANRVAIGGTGAVGARGGTDLTALDANTLAYHFHEINAIADRAVNDFGANYSMSFSWNANHVDDNGQGLFTTDPVWRVLMETIGSGTAWGKIPPYAITLKLIYVGIVP